MNKLHSIDIEVIAALIARVTLWMGQRQMIDRFGAAENQLKPGQRAGLVGTNSISQNLGRSASLEYVPARAINLSNELNADVVQRYITASDITYSPTQSPSR